MNKNLIRIGGSIGLILTREDCKHLGIHYKLYAPIELTYIEDSQEDISKQRNIISIQGRDAKPLTLKDSVYLNTKTGMQVDANYEEMKRKALAMARKEDEREIQLRKKREEKILNRRNKALLHYVLAPEAPAGNET